MNDITKGKAVEVDDVVQTIAEGKRLARRVMRPAMAAGYTGAEVREICEMAVFRIRYPKAHLERGL